MLHSLSLQNRWRTVGGVRDAEQDPFLSFLCVAMGSA